MKQYINPKGEESEDKKKKKKKKKGEKQSTVSKKDFGLTESAKVIME